MSGLFNCDNFISPIYSRSLAAAVVPVCPLFFVPVGSADVGRLEALLKSRRVEDACEIISSDVNPSSTPRMMIVGAIPCFAKIKIVSD